MAQLEGVFLGACQLGLELFAEVGGLVAELTGLCLGDLFVVEAALLHALQAVPGFFELAEQCLFSLPPAGLLLAQLLGGAVCALGGLPQAGDLCVSLLDLVLCLAQQQAQLPALVLQLRALPLRPLALALALLPRCCQLVARLLGLLLHTGEQDFFALALEGKGLQLARVGLHRALVLAAQVAQLLLQRAHGLVFLLQVLAQLAQLGAGVL